MRRVLLGLAALTLTACTSTPPKEIIVVDDKPKVKAPSPDTITMREVTWKVYDRASLEAYLAEAKKENRDVLIFVLEEDGFKALNSNIADILAYMKQRNAGVKFYEQTYVEDNTTKK
jgi:type IV pilus biogenesis protein CpaD/CtpE